MKLPNGQLAVVDDAKLRDYCLSPVHPQGKHKARLFFAALGISQQDAPLLKEVLLQAAMDQDAVPTKAGEYGQSFEVRFTASIRSKTADVLSVWMIRQNEGFPRLVTCYPV
jgi:hypothetical protein